MGHYWSEMRPYEEPRHPTPAEALGFKRVSGYDCFNQWYHEPCRQVFYFTLGSKLPDAIYRHANQCTEE